MLRPSLNIYVITNGTEIKYKVRVSDFSSTENRDGIKCTFNTKMDRYIIKKGDVLAIFATYTNVKDSYIFYPIMIVTNVNISSDLTYTVECQDEYSYLINTTEFIPVMETSNVNYNVYKDFLQKNFNIAFGDKDFKPATEKPKVTIYQMLAWIERLLLKKMYLTKKQTDKDGKEVKYNANGIFKFVGDATFSDIGKWDIPSGYKIIDILNVIKENYFINTYQSPTKTLTVNGSTQNKNPYINIFVEGPGSIDQDNTDVIKLIDNINIINDSLNYQDVSGRKVAVKGIFKYKDSKNKEIKDILYAYFDDKGNVQYTKAEIFNTYSVDKLEIGNASSITEEKRKEYLANKLKTQNYFGYDGTIDTFHYRLNLNSKIDIKFNNSLRRDDYKDESSLQKRVDGLFGVKEIVRTFNSDGLFMSITPRQQISFKNNEYKPYVNE